MTSRGRGDGLNYEVNVNGAAGRRELDALLKKIRQLGTEAVASGSKIDASTVGAAKSYNHLANEIQQTIETEHQLARSVEATRAARERANAAALNAKSAGIRVGTTKTNDDIAKERLVGQQIANNIKTRQAETAELEAQSRIALTNDKREEVADQRAQRATAMQTKATQAKLKQQEDAWGRREKEMAAEAATQARIAAESSKTWAAREAARAKEATQITRNAALEVAAMQRAEQASEKAAAQRAAIRRREVLAAQRNNQANIYNDYMAHQADNSPSVANLNATRYALYDIATTAAIVGAAISAIGVYSSYTASKFEYSFASVQRAASLTGEQIGTVRQQLLDLSTAVPTSFADISTVATLGAQMNIYGNDLDQFASTVTRFSATTNASIDTTAQTFGRLSSLLDVPTSKFENLGSAIAYVGVKSVATESEILATTQQIAGAAAVYGFTADQVVGLGAAFASLAIAPEAARGSVTRIFGDIERAVSEGEEGVTEFARIMGTDVKEAIDLWQTDPSAFFSRLVQGLSQSKTLLQDLAAIGANDVRDQNLLQRLAGSPEVLAASLQYSNQAFEDGTYLAEAYAVQTDNLQSKLTVLLNTFNALANQVGGPLNTVLKIGVDLLSWFLQVLGDTNPLVLGLIGFLSLLIGGYILLKGGQAAAIAGMLAMQTALKGLSSNAALTGISFKTLNAVFLQTQKMFLGGATSAERFAGGLNTARSGAIGFVKGFLGLAAVMAVLGLIDAAIDSIAQKFESDGAKAERFFGSTSGFGDAVKADTSAYLAGADAISAFSVKVGEGGAATEDAAAKAEYWLGVQNEVPGATDNATTAVTEQTIALGENADAWLRKALSENESIQELANNPELVSKFTELGGSIPDFIEAGLQGRGTEYVANLLQPAIDAATAKLSKLQTAAGPGADSTPDIIVAQAELDKLNTLQVLLGGAGAATDALVKSQEYAVNTSLFLGDEFLNQGDDAEVLQQQLSSLKDEISNLFSGITTEGNFAEAIDDLYAKLEAGDGTFNNFSSEGREALSSLQDAMVATIAYGQQIGVSAQDSLESLFLGLQAQGYDTTSILQQLAASPIVYTADIDVSALIAKLAAATGNTTGLSAGQMKLRDVMQGTSAAAAQNAKNVGRSGGAAGGAAKQVRTLTDYVNDLGKVFKSAFDIRFGASKALDDIRSGWQDIADANADALEKLNDYNAELLDLASKKQILEYQLGVAIDYGDTLRAGKIQAELAKITAEMASKQRDADEAGDGLNKTLVGGSAAAVKNRAEILDLVSSYNDYVQQLANTGMSSAQLQIQVDQLRSDFIAQATALGYAQSELLPYVASFGDLKRAIDAVPRNITISANADPAQRAIDEFLAANRNGRGASGGISVPVSAAFDDTALKKLARAQNILAQIASYQETLRRSPGGQAGDNAAAQIRALTNLLNSGNYAGGGFVPWEAPADKRFDNGVGVLPSGRTVGLQGGEPIINNRARSKYGDKMFDQINALSYKPNPAPTIVVQGGGEGYADYMSLGPTERGYLAEIIRELGRGLTISGTAIKTTVEAGTANDQRRRAG